MRKPYNNYAFIDGQNLNLGIQDLGWKLDFQRFRVYLKEKYGVSTAYYFIGKVADNQELYDALTSAGYVLIYKEVLTDPFGKQKGNIDAELVLQAMVDYKNYHKAVIVSGDGDFACLVTYLANKNKLARVVVPNIYRYSALLKKAAATRLDSMNDLKRKLAYKFPRKKSESVNKPSYKKQTTSAGVRKTLRSPSDQKQTSDKQTVPTHPKRKTYLNQFRFPSKKTAVSSKPTFKNQTSQKQTSVQPTINNQTTQKQRFGKHWPYKHSNQKQTYQKKVTNKSSFNQPEQKQTSVKPTTSAQPKQKSFFNKFRFGKRRPFKKRTP